MSNSRLFMLIPYSIIFSGSGFFKCGHCGSVYESFIHSTIKPRCPFCGRTIDGAIIDDIIKWGVEVFSYELDKRNAIVGFELSESAINAFLIYADNGGAYIKSQKMSESFSIEDPRKELPESLWEKYDSGRKIIVARLLRVNGKVQIDYRDWYEIIKGDGTY